MFFVSIGEGRGTKGFEDCGVGELKIFGPRGLSSFKLVFLFMGRVTTPLHAMMVPCWSFGCFCRIHISPYVVFLIFSLNFESLMNLSRWGRGAVIIATVQLYSAKSELRYYTGSNPALGELEICDVENF